MGLSRTHKHWHTACCLYITGMGRCSNYKFSLFNQESINA